MKFLMLFLFFSTFSYAVDFLPTEKTFFNNIYTMSLDQAIKKCISRGTRLPTAQELIEVIKNNGGVGLISIVKPDAYSSSGPTQYFFQEKRAEGIYTNITYDNKGYKMPEQVKLAFDTIDFDRQCLWSSSENMNFRRLGLNLPLGLITSHNYHCAVKCIRK